MQEQFNDKRYFMNKAHKLGFEYEKQYRGCSQCTVAAIQDAFGIRNDFIFQAASGLGAGGGLLGDGMCGGYSRWHYDDERLLWQKQRKNR